MSVEGEAIDHNAGRTPRNGVGRSSAPLRALVIAATILGVGLFAILVYSVGINEIVANITEFGFAGFAVICGIYLARIAARATAWNLSVSGQHSLTLRDTIPAVIVGEALSSMIPLGILVSGTAKALSVRKRVPLVVGLSSVATENIFYSFVTSAFLIIGALTLLKVFTLDNAWVITINVLIAGIGAVFLVLLVMVVRQWHFASGLLDWFIRRRIGGMSFSNLRSSAQRFEDLIYGFYRKYPRRFLPICLFETTYHALGVIEVYFILMQMSSATFLNSFLLESVSRTITIVFKFVPFMIGVDEAGAHFVAETVGVGAAVGVTLAVIRKGRILFWALVGLLIMTKRGLSFAHLFSAHET